MRVLECTGEGFFVIRTGKQGGAKGMLVLRREPGRRKRRWKGWAGEVVQREEKRGEEREFGSEATRIPDHQIIGSECEVVDKVEVHWYRPRRGWQLIRRRWSYGSGCQGVTLKVPARSLCLFKGVFTL